MSIYHLIFLPFCFLFNLLCSKFNFPLSHHLPLGLPRSLHLFFHNSIMRSFWIIIFLHLISSTLLSWDQHQCPSPSYTRRRSQYTGRGKRPLWLGSSWQNQRSIGEPLATIRKITSYLSTAFFQLHTFFWREPQNIKMVESLSFNKSFKTSLGRLTNEDILNLYPPIYFSFSSAFFINITS